MTVAELLTVLIHADQSKQTWIVIDGVRRGKIYRTTLSTEGDVVLCVKSEVPCPTASTA